MLDQGADSIFISALLLENNQQNAPEVQTARLNSAQTYHEAPVDPCITYDKAVKLDVFLQLRHGLILTLWNVKWKVAKEDKSSLVTGL